MRIIGIDPGYAIMGYGILDYKGNKFTPVAYGAITTEAHTPNEERLMILYDELSDIIREYEPDEASIEELFYNTNATTAIMVGEARGMALLACAKAGIRISEYTPLQIKSSLTGYGRAEKKQVITMVTMLLGLKEPPKPDDTADALAIAICHAHSGGSRLANYYNKP
jgi:crossover junction endodeoxyribonuclease RuvC